MSLRRIIAALLAGSATVLSFEASPETSSIGGSYELQAQIIGAGGATLSGSTGLNVDAAVGQNNATTLSGANGYTAATGFWSVQVQGGASDRIFQDGFEASIP
ncbi:MAG TPA: hypothetical protein VGH81_00340 [Rudaea sp.]|jgi:hypothetical protein